MENPIVNMEDFLHRSFLHFAMNFAIWVPILMACKPGIISQTLSNTTKNAQGLCRTRFLSTTEHGQRSLSEDITYVIYSETCL